MNETPIPEFPGKLVKKSLARRHVFHNIPRYVSEYLLAKQAPGGGEEEIRKVESVLDQHYKGVGGHEVVKDQLMRHGRFILIDELVVSADLATNQHLAHIPCMGSLRVTAPGNLTAKYPGVLHGLWGTIVLHYSPTSRAIRVDDFKPFQITQVNLPEYILYRKQFDTPQWIDFLLMSLGLNPHPLGERLKLLYLARLAPLVEPHLHLMELGPRQTGKTFFLRNASPETFVVSGGKATPATLFYHQVQQKLGIIPSHDVVVFDEVAHSNWKDPTLLSTLKDFMESGQFSRGTKLISADCSVVFMGNTDDQSIPQTQVLPDNLRQDTAFLDRLAAMLPGYEFPKLTNDSLYDGPGLVTDYLAEILKLLRKQSVVPNIDLFMPQGLTQRDTRAIRRMTSGLLKLIHPGKDWSQQELKMYVKLAVELRGRVYQELNYWNSREFAHSSLLASIPQRQLEDPVPVLEPSDTADDLSDPDSSSEETSIPS